jgi:hypothetical protein
VAKTDHEVPDYRGLNETFEEQLLRTARFVPSAFHVHTVDSHDWGKEADPQTNDRARFQDGEGQDRFLDELVQAGLEVVSITDHMRCRYACDLSQRAARRGDIAVLPGMEVNCTIAPAHRERIHVLVNARRGRELWLRETARWGAGPRAKGAPAKSTHAGAPLAPTRHPWPRETDRPAGRHELGVHRRVLPVRQRGGARPPRRAPFGRLSAALC